MAISIELPAAQLATLEKLARRLGVAPEELARAVVSDQLACPDEDFEEALREVLSKNEELYQRLS